jgi:hypothetical protein
MIGATKAAIIGASPADVCTSVETLLGRLWPSSVKRPRTKIANEPKYTIQAGMLLNEIEVGGTGG